MVGLVGVCGEEARMQLELPIHTTCQHSLLGKDPGAMEGGSLCMCSRFYGVARWCYNACVWHIQGRVSSAELAQPDKCLKEGARPPLICADTSHMPTMG